MIIVDSREASNHKKLIELLKARTEVSVDPLDIGDVSVQGNSRADGELRDERWLYEHKVGADLIQSLHDGRLWDQVKELANSYQDGFITALIFETGGVFDPQERRYMSWNGFMRKHPEIELKVSSVMGGIAKWRVPIIYTSGVEATAAYLLNLNEKLENPKERSFPLRYGFKRDWDTAKKREYLMEAFGAEVGKLLSQNTLRSILESRLTREEVLSRLPQKYLSGRSIPRKKIEEIADVLGFEASESVS